MPATTVEVPHLRKAGETWELIVDGRPYLVLGAELQNSAMSSVDYMETVWQEIKNMGVNTVLGNICWEVIEPEEGRFDFNEMDKIIAAAKSYGLRLILLWFGSFKNGMSCYVPTWVKKDPRRFPRMQCQNSSGCLEMSNVISIFHEECVMADSKAFKEFMKHLKEFDKERTVIMVQVENEVGLLGDSRDRSSIAEKLFRSPVPSELVDFLATNWDTLLGNLTINFPKFEQTIQRAELNKPSGSWEELFGCGIHTCELFMAYHYALYLEKIAAVGRTAYDIPLFTNAWLPKPGARSGLGNIVSGGNHPGEYPSGGPVATVLDVWYKFAPTLDFISPDIYTADHGQTCATYSYHGRPLFIPEQRRDDYGARRTWEVIGSFQGLGACPFGIDTVTAKDCAYTKHYTLLGSIASHILKARLKPESMIGFYFDDPDPRAEETTPIIKKTIGLYELSINRSFVLGQPGPGFGIIIELEPERYLLVGMGYRVEFKSTSPTSVFTGISWFLEKSVTNPESGALRTERILNGDESRSGKWANMPSEVPDFGDGFIPITIPARTMIAEVQVYSLDSKDIVS